MSETSRDEAHPVLVMGIVLGSLACLALLTLLITALYHSSISALTDQRKAYTEKVEKAYSADHVDLQSHPYNGNGDVQIKMIIEGKAYHCVAPSDLDLRLGETLDCAPYRISSEGIEIGA